MQAVLPFEDTDACIVTDPLNMRYLSGFRGGEGILYIGKRKNVLITDSRYTELAAMEVGTGSTEEIREGCGRVRPDCLSRGEFFVEEESRQHTRFAILNRLLEEDRAESVGYEDRSLFCSELAELQKEVTGAKRWVPAGKRIEDLRMNKTPSEVRRIRKACEIACAAFEDLLGILKEGMSELDARAELEYRFLKRGASGPAFDTICASGPNSSMPHAIPSGRKFRAGDLVTFDFGCRYDGYCSDITRTVAIGKADAEQRKVYGIVKRAQESALSRIRPGMTAQEADASARDVIQKEGYGAFFGHSLGHSLGLAIHERPSLASGSDFVLRAGLIETVEPGIYLPGRFGVRIEDTVILTENGVENLVPLPKDLMEL